MVELGTTWLMGTNRVQTSKTNTRQRGETVVTSALIKKSMRYYKYDVGCLLKTSRLDTFLSYYGQSTGESKATMQGTVTFGISS